ncbi:Transposable element Tc1 transposase [Labeo rohita]|uniref:Transposable element Tc1 transposase n=1 Tax=Labeo rohita TaxID=84645 RepID=A0ABQ8LMH8_LABRO|nr:Transposable element Tc1 transposase [Labeo rohita]
MGKTADLTVVQKTTIDTLHKEDKPQTFITKDIGCSQSAVSKHVNRKLSGRKSLQRLVKQNRFKNLGELHKEWTEAGVKASRATTHRRVKEFGYSCCIPLVKPLLNHSQCQRRVTWAKEKKKWTVAQWSKVLFSDESMFCISFENQGPRVWRNGGEAHSPVLSFHTNSPDLNPIENLWGIVKRKMRNKRPKTADELKATVKDTWASIPPQQCHRLITSMPRRIEAVIKAKEPLPSIEWQTKAPEKQSSDPSDPSLAFSIHVSLVPHSLTLITVRLTSYTFTDGPIRLNGQLQKHSQWSNLGLRGSRRLGMMENRSRYVIEIIEAVFTLYCIRVCVSRCARGRLHVMCVRDAFLWVEYLPPSLRVRSSA